MSDIRLPIACQHQKPELNTQKIRLGPDQDGRWYRVNNESTTGGNKP